MALSVLLVFLYLFAFPIANIRYIDSTVVCFFVLLIVFCFNAKLRKEFLSIVCSKYMAWITVAWTVIVVYSVFIPSVKRTYDFSIIKTFVHQFFALVAGGLLLAFLRVKRHKIFDVIILAFVAQSILQILSLVISPLREITNIFRSPTAIDIQHRYSGIRGLAISGYAVFGLAVAYGLMFIVWALEWRNALTKFNIYVKMLFGLILVVGAASAGRTGLVGFGIAVVIRLILVVFVEKPAKKEVLPVIDFCAVTIGIVAILSQIKSFPALNNLFNYVNEFFNNFINGNGFGSSSTDKLWKMYFHIGADTLFFGDGFYTASDGAYYMNTDAGYMRNILFFGVVGFVLLFVYQLLFFDLKNKKRRVKDSIYLLFILLMHVKGEVLGFLIITQSMLFMINFSYGEKYAEADSVMLNGKLQHK